MKHLPRKAITSTPELANRAPFPLVIESFLMGAPNYTVGHYDREGSMILDEFHNFLANLDVFTNIRHEAHARRAFLRPLHFRRV